MNSIIKNRLRNATEKELEIISKHLKIEESNCKNIEKIYKEYIQAAGHSVVNIFRKKELPYKQILIDVADKLHDGYGWTTYTLEDNYRESIIEDKILDDVKHKADKLAEKWLKLSSEERKKKEIKLREQLATEGYSSQAISGSIALLASGGAGVLDASPIALSLFYSGVFGSLMASIFGISMASLVAGGAIAGGLIALPAIVTIGGAPAYRKTIPVTILLIQIGKRIEMENDL